MGRSGRVALLLPVLVMMSYGSSLAGDRPRVEAPLVKMLKEGSASVSPDYKGIKDDKGRIAAKATPVPAETDFEDNYDPYYSALYAKSALAKKEDAAPPPVQKFVYTCSKKCAIVEKKCFLADDGNIICLNVCEREGMVCQERALKVKQEVKEVQEVQKSVK